MILVAGGTGFIGSHLVSLLSKKEDVRVLARKTSNTEHLAKSVEVAYGDITDKASVGKACRGVEKVYNMVGILGGSGTSEEVMWKVNGECTRHLIEAAMENGVGRFLHCSTVGVYGNQEGILKESSPCKPLTPYERSKHEGEKIALSYKSEMPVTVVRPPIVYGPRDISNILRLIQAIDKGIFRVIGSGSNFVSTVYVEDLARGIKMAGEKKKAEGEVYNLSADASTMNDFVGKISKILGKNPPGHIPLSIATAAAMFFGIFRKMGIGVPLTRERICTLTKNARVDASKAGKELGFRPKLSLEEGLGITIEWYREKGYL